jgi:hypothetical protein
LMVDLLWRMAGTGSRPSVYRAPTWSWASVDGDVYFHSSAVRQTARENLCAKLLEAVATPTHDLLGPIESGYLIVQGPLLKVKLAKGSTSSEESSLEELHLGNEVCGAGSGFEEVLDDESLYSKWLPDGAMVYFACLITLAEIAADQEYMSEGLILERTGGSRGEYRRIGWLRIFHSLPGTSIFKSHEEEHSLTDVEYLRDDLGLTYMYKVI